MDIPIAEPVYHLATPKGSKVICSLCEKPATLQCSECRCDYYCGDEHQEMAWVSIHSAVCQSLAQLKQMAKPFYTLHEQKVMDIRIKNMKTEVMKKSLLATAKHILEDRPALTQPAAHQALMMANQIHGPSSPRVVPALVAVACANIKRGDLITAECHLSKAEWILTFAENTEDALLSKMFIAWGDLAIAHEQPLQARWYFAQTLYHTSEIFSPEHVRCLLPMFRLAQVFLQMEKHYVVMSMFKSIVGIWAHQLSKAVAAQTDDTEEVYQLRDIDILQGRYVLHQIKDILTAPSEKNADRRSIKTAWVRAKNIKEYLAKINVMLAKLYNMRLEHFDE